MSAKIGGQSFRFEGRQMLGRLAPVALRMGEAAGEQLRALL